MNLISKNKTRFDLPFKVKATTALGISLIADTLDYVGAPIFALPIIGDLADGMVMTILYRLTGSKTSAALNLIEFIPFIGDMIPTYTISTLLWIFKESRKRKDESFQLSPEWRKQNRKTIASQIDTANTINR